MNDYLTIKEVAEMWELTPRRVQKMCSEGRLPGAKKFGRDWAIPKDVERPKDARITTGQYKNWRKKVEKNSRENTGERAGGKNSREKTGERAAKKKRSGVEAEA